MNVCKQCGVEISGESYFCPSCREARDLSFQKIHINRDSKRKLGINQTVSDKTFLGLVAILLFLFFIFYVNLKAPSDTFTSSDFTTSSNTDAQTDLSSQPESDSNITWGAPEYAAELAAKYSYWVEDPSKPLGNIQQKFGIVGVFLNTKYDCAIWVFDNYTDFQSFAGYAPSGFNFDADVRTDSHGNIFAAKHDVYSTTCTMEFSDTFQ